MAGPINDIAIVSGTVNTLVSGSFSTSVSGNVIQTSISGNVINVNSSISGNIITSNTSISGNTINVNTSISGNVVTFNQTTGSLGDPFILTKNLSSTSGLNFLPDVPVTSGVQFRTVFPGQNPTFFVGGSTSGNFPSIGNGNNSVGIPLPPFLPITNLNQISIAVLADTSPVQLNYFAITVSG